MRCKQKPQRMKKNKQTNKINSIAFYEKIYSVATRNYASVAHAHAHAHVHGHGSFAAPTPRGCCTLH